jgi:hypothetical protein
MQEEGVIKFVLRLFSMGGQKDCQETGAILMETLSLVLENG